MLDAGAPRHWPICWRRRSRRHRLRPEHDLADLRALARPGPHLASRRRGDRDALDHDANVSPWVLAARDAGRPVQASSNMNADCTLDLDDLRPKLSPRTKLVAVAAAPERHWRHQPDRRDRRMGPCRVAHWCLSMPCTTPRTGSIDVPAWDCDFLACSSAYKFFGPHVGILWGRRALLERWRRTRCARRPAHAARQVDDRHAKPRSDRRGAGRRRVSGRPGAGNRRQ